MIPSPRKRAPARLLALMVLSPALAEAQAFGQWWWQGSLGAAGSTHESARGRSMTRYERQSFTLAGELNSTNARLVADIVKATGVSRNTIKDHLKALTKSGHLVRHGAGRGADIATAP